MRILQVSRCVLPLTEKLTGGAEHYLIETSRNLAKNGHEVHIVADASPGIVEQLADEGIQVHGARRFPLSGVRAVNRGFYGWIAMHLWGNLSAHRKTVELTRSLKFDIVHHHGSLAQLLSSTDDSVPSIFTLHDSGPWLGNYPKRAERALRKVVFSQIDARAFRKAKHVSVVFNELKQHLVDQWDMPPERISVINPGVDVDRFAPDNGKRDLGFLFTGHMIKRKGVELLGPITRRNPNFSITFIGDGPELANMKRFASDHRLSDRMTFVGAMGREEMPGYMRKASALVLPASSEGLPLTVLESLSASTPVIAFNVGGIKDAVKDSWNGFLVEPNNVQMLEMKMREMHDGGTALIKRMGENGRKTILERFSWASVTKRIENEYASIAGTPPLLEMSSRVA